MGLFGILWKVVAVAIVAVIGLGAYLYFSDYEASATVVERGEDNGGTYAVIVPDVMPSYRYKAYLDEETWSFVCSGYNVKFHIKSQEYRVYDAQERLVYDSATGRLNQQAAIECGVTNTPGGGIFG